MTLSRIELLFSAAVLLQVLTGSTKAQIFSDQCLTTFTQGKENFVLDADESLKEGATFISSPAVTNTKDCIVSCCKNRQCNLALMENGDEGSIKSCYLFDCLYKQKKVCRFVRKDGFNNYVLTSVFGNDLDKTDTGDDDDKPPIASAGQDRVVQPQETVTLNGVQSKDDKEIVSYKWRMLSGHFAVIEKTTFDDEVIVSNLSSGVYKFQLTVTDSIGQSNSAQVTVLVLTPEQSNHHCLVPKKVGPCRASYPRWHYNAASGKCEEFNFGGCRENRNNYISQAECETACDGISVETETGGTGRRVTPMLDPVEKCGGPCQSDQFTCSNGCCLDPGLECDGKTQCGDGSDEESCNDLNKQLEKLRRIPVDEIKVRCTEPPNTGPCRASMTKWFYDPYDRTCSRFNFGGCNGNDNQFESQDICALACQGVTDKDVFARRGEFTEYQGADSDKGTLIIAVLLGVAILVLLALVGYCFLKGRKERQPRHQRTGVNGTHANTLEYTEKLVYNSTTKPI